LPGISQQQQQQDFADDDTNDDAADDDDGANEQPRRELQNKGFVNKLISFVFEWSSINNYR